MISLKTAKLYKTEILFQIYITVIITKFCSLLKLQHDIWTERLGNIIDIVRVAIRNKIWYRRV